MRERPILFQRWGIQAILEGRKTQTRRIADYRPCLVDDLLWVKSKLFQRKADTTLWLKVTDVRVERLQDITEADVLAEGCIDKEDFIQCWDKIYAKLWHPWDRNPFVWVITFKIERVLK